MIWRQTHNNRSQKLTELIEIACVIKYNKNTDNSNRLCETSQAVTNKSITKRIRPRVYCVERSVMSQMSFSVTLVRQPKMHQWVTWKDMFVYVSRLLQSSNNLGCRNANKCDKQVTNLAKGIEASKLSTHIWNKTLLFCLSTLYNFFQSITVVSNSISDSFLKLVHLRDWNLLCDNCKQAKHVRTAIWSYYHNTECIDNKQIFTELVQLKQWNRADNTENMIQKTEDTLQIKLYAVCADEISNREPFRTFLLKDRPSQKQSFTMAKESLYRLDAHCDS